MRKLLLSCALALGATGAVAGPLVTLHANNGSLPPPYHRHSTTSVDSDGTVRMRLCLGYSDDDASCTSLEGKASAEAVAALQAAIAAADLVARPMAEMAQPPVGGGSVSGSVLVEGVALPIPAFEVEADSPRKAAIIEAVGAAIPAELSAAAKAAMQ